SDDYRYSGGILTTRYFKQYDSFGVLLRSLTQTYYTNGRTKTSDDYLYTGGVKTQRYYQSYNSAGVRTRFLLQTYHPDGIKVQTSDDYYYSSLSKLTKRILSQYDSQGVLTSSVTTLFPQTILTSDRSYLLAYFVDGIQYQETLSLTEGENVIQKQIQGYGGVQVTMEFRITLDPPSAPVIVFTSPATSSEQAYLLTYTVDGVPHSETWLLGSGQNHLIVPVFNSNGDPFTAEYEVQWTASSAPSPIPGPGDLSDAISITTQDGFVLKYLNGDLVSIEKPGEYTLASLEFDGNNGLTGGLLTYQSGSQIFYANNDVIWFKDPQGTTFYPNLDGTVRELIDVNSRKTVFSYRKDGSAQTDLIVAANNEVASLYDASGKLLKAIKSDRETITYEAGVLKSIELSTGTLIEYTKTILTSGCRVDLVSVAPNTYPASIQYDAEGQIVEVVEQSGARIQFEGGIPKHVIDTDRIASDYSFQTNALGHFIGFSLNRLGYVQEFDDQGNLVAINLSSTDDNGDLVLNGQAFAGVQGFEVVNGEVRRVVLENGTTVDITGDYTSQSAQIENGTVTFPDGSSGKYVNGELVEIKTSDGLVYRVTRNGTDYVANLVSSTTNSEKASQFIYDENLNLVQLQRLNQEVVHFRSSRIDSVQPNCTAQQTSCEEPQYFYYETDRTIVVQGSFSTRPDLSSLPIDGSISYSVSTYDLQGQPLEIRTIESGKMTRVNFSYGAIRFVEECDLSGANCAEKYRYTYEFDAVGNEITVITELATGTVRKYQENRIIMVTTQDNIVTTYTYDDQKKLQSSVMSWQGRTLESYTYAYDEANNLTKITDSKGVTKIYDVDNVLVGVIQGNQEFKIYHFTENGEERTAQELVKETNEEGIVFHYQMGKVTKIEYPDGTVVEEIVEDTAGKIFSARIHHPNGSVERIINGKRVEIVKPDGTIWEYEDGKLVSMSDAFGNVFTYEYVDGSVFLSANDSWKYRYDSNGQLVEAINPTSIYDLSTSSHLVTTNGDVKVDTTQSKFGGASIDFDGSGDFLTVADSDDWDFGTGQFTVEGWFRWNANQNGYLWQRERTSNSTLIGLYYNPGEGLSFYVNGSELGGYSFTPELNRWYHIALVRNGTGSEQTEQTALYIDGVQARTYTCATDFQATAPFNIGGRGRYYGGAESFFGGQIDELRISKGVARWTSKFTLPTSALKPDQYTKFLLETSSDAPLAPPPSQLDLSALSLNTISYSQLATTLSQTSTD
ncbi:MAG: hypothetical protein HY351_01530, partial [Candidatus Omnitrophica bacterium]|nr:hypothetical protein [Candidatus Omnitrophota bacterium]